MTNLKERWKSFCSLLRKVTIFTFLILLSPLLLLLLFTFTVYKYGFVNPLKKYFKPKLEEMLNEKEAFYSSSDRMWEDSRGSSGLILVLKGNVSVIEMRERFTSGILKTTDSTTHKFPRLTQIPTSFGGYYFWHPAKYFLIHEHIRPIEKVIDTQGLKKFAGTVLTLPFPNKRPPWEILVFPYYQKDKDIIKESQQSINVSSSSSETSTSASHSALVIRMHPAIGTPQMMMEIVSALCSNKTKPMIMMNKLPDITRNVDSYENPKLQIPSLELEFEQDCKSQCKFRTLWDFTSTFFFPPSSSSSSTHYLLNELISLCDDNPNTTVSWGSVNLNNLNQQKSSYSPGLKSISKRYGGDIELALAVVVAKTLMNSDDDESGLLLLPKKSEKSPKDDIPHPEDHELITFLDKTNALNFLKLEQNSKDCGHQENHENVQIQIDDIPSASTCFFNILTVFPHTIVRSIVNRWFRGGGVFLYQSCGDTDLTSLNNGSDLMFIGDHQLVDVIPLCGLYFKHTAFASTSLRFQNNLKFSLTINSSIIPDVSMSSSLTKSKSSNKSSTSISAKYLVEKQERVDQIANLIADGGGGTNIFLK